MYIIEKESSPHDWKKTNLVTLKDKNGLFDRYVCKKCNLRGKSYRLSTIEVSGRYKQSRVMFCEVREGTKDEYLNKKIKITNFTGFGEKFSNLVDGSIHEVVKPIDGYIKDKSGVWVQGVGEPVRVLSYEYEFVNES